MSTKEVRTNQVRGPEGPKVGGKATGGKKQKDAPKDDKLGQVPAGKDPDGLAEEGASAWENQVIPEIHPELERESMAWSQEQERLMEEQLLKDGKFLSPLIVWKGKNILVDGHRRLALCKKYKRRFEIVEMEFA